MTTTRTTAKAMAVTSTRRRQDPLLPHAPLRISMDGWMGWTDELESGWYVWVSFGWSDGWVYGLLVAIWEMLRRSRAHCYCCANVGGRWIKGLRRGEAKGEKRRIEIAYWRLIDRGGISMFRSSSKKKKASYLVADKGGCRKIIKSPQPTTQNFSLISNWAPIPFF